MAISLFKHDETAYTALFFDDVKKGEAFIGFKQSGVDFPHGYIVCKIDL